MGKFFDQLKNVELGFKVSIFFNIIQFFILILMLFVLFKINSAKIIEISIPPTPLPNKEMYISSNNASDSAFKVWTEHYVNTYANHSPKSIADKFKYLLAFVDPQEYFKFKKDLLVKATKVKTEFITQKYDIKKTIVKREKDHVKVTTYGLLTKQIGSTYEFKDMPYNYTFKIFMASGNFLIKGIKEEIPNRAIKEQGEFRDKNIKEYKDKNKYLDKVRENVQPQGDEK